MFGKYIRQEADKAVKASVGELIRNNVVSEVRAHLSSYNLHDCISNEVARNVKTYAEDRCDVIVRDEVKRRVAKECDAMAKDQIKSEVKDIFSSYGVKKLIGEEIKSAVKEFMEENAEDYCKEAAEEYIEENSDDLFDESIDEVDLARAIKKLLK